MDAVSSPSDATAVIGRRVLATLLDAALVIVPAVLMVSAEFEYLPVAELNASPSAFCDTYLDQIDNGVCLDLADATDSVYFADGISAAPAAVYWLGTIALLVLLQGLTGFTPGKLIAGIRTVGPDGRRPGVGRCLVRWVLWIIDAFPYVIPLLGFIVALTTPQHQRVGDMAAKTFVVRRSAAGTAVGTASVPTTPGGVQP